MLHFSHLGAEFLFSFFWLSVSIAYIKINLSWINLKENLQSSSQMHPGQMLLLGDMESHITFIPTIQYVRWTVNQHLAQLATLLVWWLKTVSIMWSWHKLTSRSASYTTLNEMETVVRPFEITVRHYECKGERLCSTQ